MNTKIKNFSPTNDWYFVYDDGVNGEVHHMLAGFATIEIEGQDDYISGMVPIEGGGPYGDRKGICKLGSVPQVKGIYKHKSQIKNLKHGS